MTNLESLLRTPLQKVNKILVWIFLVLSLIGFLDATYLTAKHYVGGPIICPIFGGCEKVLNSPYSMIGFVPVALLGVFYYSLMLVLIVAYFNSEEFRFLKIASASTFLGLLASIWFMFVQFFIIQALCFYCVVSAFISVSLFILGIVILKTTKYPENSRGIL